MAFVFKDDRFKTDKNNNYVDYYLGHKEFKAVHNKVPFNTSIKKETLLKENMSQPKLDPKKEIRKVLITEEKEKIKNKIINKKAYPFNVSDARMTKLPKNNAPGPGQYDIKSEFNKYAKQTINNNNNNIIEKEYCFPSIPVGKQAYGYSEVNNKLILNKPKININFESNANHVGPGSYNINTNFNTKKNCVQWKKDKTINYSKKLLAQIKNSSDNYEPEYSYPSTSVSTLYKLKPSSFFVKTTSSSISNSQLSNNLGPGQYYNSDKYTSFKKAKKDLKFQLFGSGSIRFNSNTNDPKINVPRIIISTRQL